MILAGLSIVGGFLGIPESLGGNNAIEHWLDPVFERANVYLSSGHTGGEFTEYILMALSVALAVSAIMLARTLYLRKQSTVERIANVFKAIHTLLWNKYYVDELYDFAIVSPILSTSRSFLWKFFDVKIVDGAVNGAASLAGFSSKYLRRIQTGVAQNYAMAFVVGLIVVLGVLLFR